MIYEGYNLFLNIGVQKMFSIRKSDERGFADHGWLQSYHSFSFAGYQDPANMGWGNLRVINEDWIAPARGFGTHGHQNMEIITYVLEGAIGHKDSLGNGESIPPGDVQRMSAGSGITHSEFNHAHDMTTHLLQIWIQPNIGNIVPSYEQKHFSPDAKRGKLVLVASNGGVDGSVHIQADARMFAGLLDGEEKATITLDPKRRAYVHVVKGQVRVNDHILGAGDAAKIAQENLLVLSEGKDCEVIVFDLAA
jgi:quercetin 2,3-dioxygenase